MPSVQPCAPPEKSLLSRYVADGAFTDCYVAELCTVVSQPQFIEALYLGTLMRFERKLIGWLLAKPTSIVQVRELATGEAASFAAWHVEGRTSNELLLRDQTGRTRSWLMSQAMPAGTRLYFGSALLPRVHPKTGAKHMGPLFKALLGFHVLYSKLLLSSARSRLERVSSGATP